MTKTLLAAALLSVIILGAASAEDQHGKAGHQHRSAEYEQGTKVASNTPATKNADGKRLPGRDCKLYEGSTRFHGWPQYEIGNPDRPECPPETK